MPVQTTDIGWTDLSANHWRACVKVSEGCRFCWAADMAARFDRTPEPWTVDNIDVNLQVYDEDAAELLHRHPANEPAWCFYPSSSDPFLPWVPEEAERDYFNSIVMNDHICFQVLTKWGPENDRAEQEAAPDEYEPTRNIHPAMPDHAMLGVTVETELRTYRLDWLREQEAAVKFVSFEPLLERIETPDLSGIDWAIIGGETHVNSELRREMEPEWAIHLIEHCWEQGVAPFFKQHSGAYAEAKTTIGMPVGDGLVVEREVHEFPDVPDGLPATPRAYLS